MSFPKEPPVDDGPIPFGNPGQGGGHQGLFGSQQQLQHQQQQQQPNAPPSGYHQSTSGSDFYGNPQAQGAPYGNQHATATTTSGASQFFDQYQTQPTATPQQPQQPQQHQQAGSTLTQSYDPSLYQHHYAESVMSGDTNYQHQHYQSFDPAQQQQYYQQYQQPYDATQQYNYSQQPQYDYSQQQAYAYNASQQQQPQYDYSQQQYDYSQQYDYGQQGQYDTAQYDSSQQQYDTTVQQQQRQQSEDTSQHQYGTATQEQQPQQQQSEDPSQPQYGAIQQQQQPEGTSQQQYDTAIHQQQQQQQQQKPEGTPQHQFDTALQQQQQQSDVIPHETLKGTPQQQYDLSQQYDSSQPYDFNQTFVNEQQQSNGQNDAVVPESNAVDWNQWEDQQVAPGIMSQGTTTAGATLAEPATSHQQEPSDTKQEHDIGGDSQQQVVELKPTKPVQQHSEELAFDHGHQGQQQHQPFGTHVAGQEQTIYEYVDQEGYQHVGFQPPEQNDISFQQEAPATNLHQTQLPSEQPQESSQSQASHVEHPIKEDIQQIPANVDSQGAYPMPAFTSDHTSVNNALGVQPNHFAATPTFTTSDINSPQSDFVTMVPCPDPMCEGENKPRAKFCSECGRPLAAVSRASTPAMTPFSPQPYQQQQQQIQPLPAQPVPDPLQRNKGCPLATFGFGGKLCLMFPHKLNNQDATVTKVMPGLVQMKHVDEVVFPDSTPLSDFVVGPVVDGHGDIATKQQHVMAYMDRRINGFQEQLHGLEQGSVASYQLESKVLLWQIVRALVETMTGDSSSKEAAIYHVLVQNPAQNNVLETLRSYLMQGDRAGALHYAIQEKMWSHGLILGKSLDDTEETWRSVVDQFLADALSREEGAADLTPVGDVASLRVLYALLSGAGGPGAVSQFIPKYPSRHLDEHLLEWRETLTLILANRPVGSGEAIKSLGALLKDNKWVDAAEICSTIVAGTALLPDDASVYPELLLGSQEGDVSAPLDALYLTEIFEFALSLEQQNKVKILPFLQGYKLVHAWWLADAGFIQEASLYLQAIITGVLAYDKPNSYLHQGFVENLKEFTNLIRDSSESAISIDLDASLQQLEIKINNNATAGQDQVVAPVTEEDVPKETTKDTVLEPPPATTYDQEVEPSNAQHQPNGYEATGVNDMYDSTQHQIVDSNAGYDSHYQYNQDNSGYEQQQEQVDHSYGYEAQQPQQEQGHEWQHYQETPVEVLAVNDETKVSDLPQLHYDEPAQDLHSNPKEEPSESNNGSGPPLSTDDSAAAQQQDTQPATLPATQDYSMPSYDHNSGGYTMTYDSQDYSTSTYAAQDQDYVTTTYVAQDYTTTYEAQDYSYESHHEQQPGENHQVESTQEVTPSIITAHDPSATPAATLNDTYTHDQPYESQPPPSNNDTASSFEAQYASMPTQHTQDHTSTYEPNGTYGGEPAPLSAYTSQEYAPVAQEEPIKTTTEKEEGTNDDDDGLGLGNSSTKKPFHTEEKKAGEDQQEPAPSDGPKDSKSTDDEGDDDDKQDRKGWGLFSMFSRASPAPMDKDEKRAVKANLGESSTFYFDEKEGRWVNKNVSDSPAAPAKLPPPPKSAANSKPPTPQLPPPSTPQSATSPPPAASPMPPSERPPLQDLMNTPPPTARRGPPSGKKKPMRSRYVDVFNAPT